MFHALPTLLFLAAVSAVAQPVFVSEFNYNPYDAGKSPLNTWDGTNFSHANVMIGQSMQAARTVHSFRTPDGRIYVVATQSFYGNNFFTFEYSNGLYTPKGQIRVGNAVTDARVMVLSPDCSRAYVLTGSGHLWPIDITDLANPQIGAPISVAAGLKMDIRPQGDRIIVVSYNAAVHDVNLITGTVTTLNLSLPYYQPQVRFSPDGTVAYFGLEDAQHSFVVLNTATYPATLNKVVPGPGGSFGMYDLAFHPTQPRAYFTSWPSGGSASSSLYVIDTTTHTPLGFANVLPQNAAHYTVAIEPDGSKLWIAGAFNGFYLYGVPLNAAGTPQFATFEVYLPGLTTAISTVAVPRAPVGASPSFLVTIGTRSGTQASRQWPLRILNTGPVAVFNAQISQLILTQTAGPAQS